MLKLLGTRNTELLSSLLMNLGLQLGDPFPHGGCLTLHFILIEADTHTLDLR